MHVPTIVVYAATLIFSLSEMNTFTYLEPKLPGRPIELVNFYPPEVSSHSDDALFCNLRRTYAANCRAKRDTTEGRTQLDIIQLERQEAGEILLLDKVKARKQMLLTKLARSGCR